MDVEPREIFDHDRGTGHRELVETPAKRSSSPHLEQMRMTVLRHALVMLWTLRQQVAFDRRYPVEGFRAHAVGEKPSDAGRRWNPCSPTRTRADTAQPPIAVRF
jgi:hypothetical protein